ncbi:MAG: glycosyltransferase family 4 protein [Chitinophagales bacterium]
MTTSVPPYILYIAAIVSAAAISMYSIQKIIFITRHRKLYDIPDDTRKIHGAEIPSLGGIGIFIGYIITAAFFWPHYHYFMPFVLSSSVILFFTGIYDDIMNMRPSKKLIAQLVASFITIYFADIRIESFYGIFGLGLIPYRVDIIFTTLCCTFFINVFNFIDGIDGLAGVLAVLYTGLLGLMFACTEHGAIAGISFALTGATAGLLFYNIAPAKIYMGDTGSMFLGFSIFIFSVLFINWSSGDEINTIAQYIHGPRQAMILVTAMLFLPVFDALRVFILRVSRGISPLKADRTHLHYYLLDAGFTHSQSVLIILTIHVLLIGVAYLMQDMNALLTLPSLILLSGVALFVVYRLRENKQV